MTFVRRDAWSLSKTTPWPSELQWYAVAVRAMQTRPISDPTSWQYQAAIHGLAGTLPPPGAPWNSCQHSTWFFLPWHRMYLFQFEAIVRQAVLDAGGPSDWALPYWNYEDPGQGNRIPPAFRQATLPDGTPNPLLVSQRRTGINTGLGLPPSVTSSTAAAALTIYTTPAGGAPVGFGGPRTGFAHFGPAPGELENQPHNIVHVAVGGPGGLMTDPDTAALDPIFWLHHSNIDRLWETWSLTTAANPTVRTWGSRTFRLRDAEGKTVRMRIADVVDAADLDYTYDVLPTVASTPQRRAAVPRSRPKTVASSDEALTVGRDGASLSLSVGSLPTGTTASDRRAPRYHLKLTDISGEINPGIVYGVYVGEPGRPEPTDPVGLVSFFGIEHSTAAGSQNPQQLTYTFDITDLVAQLGAHGDLDRLEVALRPVVGGADDGTATTAVPAPVTVGTVAVLSS